MAGNRMRKEDGMESNVVLFALVTGASSGVGLALVHRFVDYYQQQQQKEQQKERQKEASPPSMVLVLAVRNRVKMEQALEALLPGKKEQQQQPPLLRLSVEILPCSVDLSRAESVQHACRVYSALYPRLDRLYLNAGVLPVEGMDWWETTRAFLQSPTAFFLGTAGMRQQRGLRVDADPELGWVFAANTLGHFGMVRELEDLLAAAENARVIWTGSQTDPSCFSWQDMQCIHGYFVMSPVSSVLLTNLPRMDSTHPYESSKYVAELLSLAWNQEQRAKNNNNHTNTMKMVVADPGVCVTNIAASNLSWFVAVFLMTPFLFVMRWVIPSVVYYPYAGAVSLFYLSGLPGVEELLWSSPEEQDIPNSVSKYSSASDFWDRAHVLMRQVNPPMKEDYSRNNTEQDTRLTLANGTRMLAYLDALWCAKTAKNAEMEVAQ